VVQSQSSFQNQFVTDEAGEKREKEFVSSFFNSK